MNAHLNCTPKSLVKYTLFTGIWSGFSLVNVKSEVLLHSWHTGENKIPPRERDKWVAYVSSWMVYTTAPSRSYHHLFIRRENRGSKCKKRQLAAPRLGSGKVRIPQLHAWFQSPPTTALCSFCLLQTLPPEQRQEASLGPRMRVISLCSFVHLISLCVFPENKRIKN